MPSLEVAQSCSTVSREASNRAGEVFSTCALPVAASASHWLDGVRKLVTLTIRVSSASEVEVTPMVESFGTSTADEVQPFGPCRKLTSVALTLS